VVSAEPVVIPAAGDPLRQAVQDFYERHHEGVEHARQARHYYYEYLTSIIRARVPRGQRVLDIGCGSGDLLAALEPSYGVGIDLSRPAVTSARLRHKGPLHFVEGDGGDPALLSEIGGPFDVILLVNVVTLLTDVQRTFDALRAVCHSRTRLMVYSYSRLWPPVVRAAEWLGMKHQPPPEAWLPPEEIRSMLSLAEYDVVRNDAQARRAQVLQSLGVKTR